MNVDLAFDFGSNKVGFEALIRDNIGFVLGSLSD